MPTTRLPIRFRAHRNRPGLSTPRGPPRTPSCRGPGTACSSGSRPFAASARQISKAGTLRRVDVILLPEAVVVVKPSVAVAQQIEGDQARHLHAHPRTHAPERKLRPDDPDLGDRRVHHPDDTGDRDPERARGADQDSRPRRDTVLGSVHRPVANEVDPALRPLELQRQHGDTGEHDQQTRTRQHESGNAHAQQDDTHGADQDLTGEAPRPSHPQCAAGAETNARSLFAPPSCRSGRPHPLSIMSDVYQSFSTKMCFAASSSISADSPPEPRTKTPVSVTLAVTRSRGMTPT